MIKIMQGATKEARGTIGFGMRDVHWIKQRNTVFTSLSRFAIHAKGLLGEFLFHLHPQPDGEDWVYRPPLPCFFIFFDQVQFLQLP